MKGEQLLIVEKSFLEEERLQELLAELGERHRLDAFTARQRLWGRGLALFARGGDPKLQAVADLLADHGIGHWLLTPSPPRLEPRKISGLSLAPEAMTFTVAGGQVALRRGEAVLAVLADLSGAVAEKGVRRLLLHQAYRGTTAGAGFSAEELQTEILRSRPVLDLYLLTPEYAVREAVRIFPGRFNPAGLGERAGYSSAGNLRAVMELAQGYAGEWQLRTEFGLASLPGCQLKKGEESSALDRENLASLTRFGWLMADLLAQSNRRTASDSRQSPLPAALATVLQAELSGDGGKNAGTERPPLPPGLPLPPAPDSLEDRPASWLSWKRLGLLPAAFGLLPLLVEQPALRAALFDYGFRYGLLPALMSLLLFWRGFRALHLKRQIENTPTSRVRSLAMGLVELHGRAERRYALVSPMTQMSCVWYRLSKFRIGEKGERRPLGTLDSGPVPFILDDGTGRVVVNPRGANVLAQTRNEGSPAGGLLGVSHAGDGDEHWVEEVIAEGASLYVLGFARPLWPAPASLKARVIERLRLLKASADKMQPFDSDGDGRISDDEWAAARRVVEQELLDESLSGEPPVAAEAERVEVGRPPHRAHPFVISEAASELHLAGGFGWRSGLYLGVAVACGVWTILNWLTRLHLI